MEREKGEDDGRWALGEWRGDKSNGWRRREAVLSGGGSHQAREIPRLTPNTALRFYFSLTLQVLLPQRDRLKFYVDVRTPAA